jgi:ribonuclease J
MTLRIIPLGGLGEIGMNCLVLEQRDELVVIDCGVTFPTEKNGTEVIHPRFDYILERREKLRGIVITHCHEDHIGALPYLLDALDVGLRSNIEAPVWAPPHAMELIRLRLGEFQRDPRELSLTHTAPGQPFEVGSFHFEPIRVTHSIADATALAIRTDAGLVVHTGDFKLDPAPTDGELTDEARLSALGEEGVRLLLSDSTNIGSKGTTASERDVGEELEEIVRGSTTRVVVGIFASNVQRLLHLGRIAEKAKRRIVLLGRSVHNHVRVATALGRLGLRSDTLVSPEIAMSLPRKDVLVIASGTQAEPLAALARLASGEHPRMKLEAGDQVVFSSRIIPGNDRAVYDLYAAFLRRGIEVLSRATHPGVHASGHAHRDELTRMIELCCPQAFIPVHGTLHHLHRHAELARSLGVAEVTIIENGDVAEIERETPARKVGRAPVGRVFTAGTDPIAPEVLREREKLSRGGVLTVAISLSPKGALTARAKVEQSGVLGELDRDVLGRSERAVEAAVQGAIEDGATRGDLVERVRLAARRTVDAHLGQKPHVIVSVLETDA